jgi:hypothetical protein
MEHLIGLLFGLIVMAGAWASFTVTEPLFAHLPVSEWLRLSMGYVLGLFNALTVILLGIDLLAHGFKLRESAPLLVLVVWLPAVIACGVACITDDFLAARRLPCWEEQLWVTVVSFGVWALELTLLGRWKDAENARLLAASRQKSE